MTRKRALQLVLDAASKWMESQTEGALDIDTVMELLKPYDEAFRVLKRELGRGPDFRIEEAFRDADDVIPSALETERRAQTD